MDKCAIVTGANGFVGSAVTKELLDNGYTVYAVVRDGKGKNLPKHKALIAVASSLETISDLKNKIPANQATLFYHFAWAGSAGAARADSDLQLNNVKWSLDAIKVAKELGCQKFIFASSIGEEESLAVSTTDGTHPDGHYIYGAAKFSFRLYAYVEANKLGIDLEWAKLTNGYGVGDTSMRMLNATLKKCICGESPQFTAGTQNYDFVYITDVARAFRLIGEKGKAFHEYVIGSGHAKPLKELLLEMQQAVAPDLEFIFGDIPFTGINLSLSAFDIAKLRHDTGYEPQVSFAKGCRMTYDWLKKQMEQKP